MGTESKNNASNIISVAVPIPLRKTFDFFAPSKDLFSQDNIQRVNVGARVKVPFGSRQLIGIITQVKTQTDHPLNKVKSATEILDAEPIFSADLLKTLTWISNYYLAPIGEVFDAALPSALRQGKSITVTSKVAWTIAKPSIDTTELEQSLKRSPLQLAIMQRFILHKILSATDFRLDKSSWRSAIKSLLDKNLLNTTQEKPRLVNSTYLDARLNKSVKKFELNDAQKGVIENIGLTLAKQQFSTSLLHGVTSSGKTEIYFSAITKTLKQQQQVLLLVPEIGLTPQLIKRVETYFNVPVTSLHSGLNDTEQHLAWWYARTGQAKIVIGTRSAVFTAFNDLGLIIVDEEHDSSFKQQDGVRYHARDVAVYRAKQLSCPIILASATPSLETLANAKSGRYEYHRITQRATNVALPKIELFDSSAVRLTDGLTPMMVTAIKQTLANNKQVMLFLNRRGYSPVLYCADCSWKATCHRCDSYLTFHQRINRVRCHHCGYEAKPKPACGGCGSDNMVEVGEGTQRVEEGLQRFFPQAKILRIDRDSTRKKGQLAQALSKVENNEVDILIGTQLLTKGHDFPNVEMVGILNTDQGLISTDFRATEYLFQLLLQVAGRAGRRDTPGRVYIQTAFSHFPFFDWVKNHDYDGYADYLLQERKQAEHPPFGYFALLRAESTDQQRALQFLRQAKSEIHALDGVFVMDAIPAPMERRAGKYRAQLLISSNLRSNLNASLSHWCDQAPSQKTPQVKWSIDIDPIDLY